MKNYQSLLENRPFAASFNPRLKIFVKEYLIYKKNKKRKLTILDIGCGKKSVLYDYKQKEDHYVGCDYYKKINRKIDEYKLVDLNKDNLDKVFKGRKFDVIFCGEVIEHLYSPDSLLDEIRNLMKEDGILILSTPNLSYYVNRILLLFGILPLFLEPSSDLKIGRKFSFLGQGHIPEGHIRVFTYGALKDLLNMKKYKILKEIPLSTWNFFPDKIMSLLSKSFAPDNIFILGK